MRFLLTFGRLVLFDVTMFQIQETHEDPDVVVVHHYNEDDEDKPDGPTDFFGKPGSN